MAVLTAVGGISGMLSREHGNDVSVGVLERVVPMEQQSSEPTRASCTKRLGVQTLMPLPPPTCMSVVYAVAN